jgi:phenylacetic acid degradation operon negative regulatory protein
VQPTAKSLVLDLLSATSGEPASVKRLVQACGLFDISENSVRVTIARLSSAGLIEAAGRGEYRLAEGAAELAREVSRWRTAEKRVRAYEGGYVAVLRGETARGDKALVVAANRALSLNGFAELRPRFFVRPDNLEGGVEALRDRLSTLGLEKGATLFRADDFDVSQRAAIASLWDGKALTASYRKSRQRLEAWLVREPALERDVAVREVFLLGAAAIRQVVYDPLLPAPLVDETERRAFVETVQCFDRVGRGLWFRFLGFRLGAAAASNVPSPTSGGALLLS